MSSTVANRMLRTVARPQRTTATVEPARDGAPERRCDDTSELTPANRRTKSWLLACGASTFLHSGLLAVFAFFWTLLPQEVRDSAIESLFVTESPETALTELTVEAEIPPQNTAPIVAGGLTADLFKVPMRTSANSLAPPSEKPSLAVALSDSDWISAFAGDVVGLSRQSADSKSGTGFGSGNGTGAGDGDGDSFFGLRPEGRRFVFVLDCSRSMNHPHGTDAKTRFKRMKMELVKVVFAMNTEQEFFFVFFNHLTIPMPAAGAAQANPVTKERYLTWMSGLPADGDTEPTAALQLALQLRPDVIYFLTDGSFIHRVQDEMLSLRTGSTRIHAFAFAEQFVTDERQRAFDLLESGEPMAARRAAGSKRAYESVREIWSGHEFLRRFSERHHGTFRCIPYDG